MNLIGGLNVMPCGYFAGVWPFNNLFLGKGFGYVGADPVTVNANGWIVNAPNNWNHFTQIHVAVAPDPLHKYRNIRSGNYTVTWNAPGWALTLEGASVSSIVENVSGRYTINVAPGNTSKELDLRIKNQTGGVSSLNESHNVNVFHANDEVAVLAGTLWQADYLNFLRPSKILRFMDCLEANLPGTVALEFSDIRTMATASFGNGRYPYELMAMLCAEIGADMWLAFPVTYTVDHFRRAAAAIAAVTAFTGKLYLECGNEVWLFLETRNYLKDIIGKGLDPDGDAQTIALYNFDDGALVAAKGDTTAYNAQSDNQKCANAMGLVMSKIWAAFETAAGYGAVPGRSRTRRVHAGQADFFGANQAALWQYDLAGGSPGTRLKDLIDVGAFAPYIDPTATAAIPTITLDALIRAKNYNNSLSDWLDVFKAGITAMLTGWNNYRTSLAAMSPQAELHTYECGVGQYVTLLSNQGSYYAYTLDTTGNDSMDFGISIATAFDNGEQVHLHSGDSTPSSALVAGGRYLVRKNGTNKLWVYANQAAYDADTVPDGTGAAVLNGAAGTRYLTNFTRLELIDSRIKEFLDSAEGRLLYEDYKTRVFDEKINSFVHYSDLGGYWLGGCWCLKDTQFTTDTPRVEWFRSLEVEEEGEEEEEEVVPSSGSAGGNPLLALIRR